MIRLATPNDAQCISEIYNYYIAHSIATFELDPTTADDFSQRIQSIVAVGLPWLVAEDDQNTIVGYAYASKWKGRCAYRHSVESTVYISHDAASQGWGAKLYETLFSELRKRSIHTVIGGISLPNEASVALHEKFGMDKVAHFKDVGFKFDKWIDVGYWQCMLNC